MDEMDNYTKRILESVEKRSKTLGISNMSKVPLSEYNNTTTTVAETKPNAGTKTVSRRRSSERKPSTETTHRLAAVRTMSNEQITGFDIDAKENVDLALEINITTGPNVQVQVAVEEQEVDDDGNVINKTPSQRRPSAKTIEGRSTVASGQSSCIRDSSRNRLQRLGALYSDSENLSSPIHRTEPNFVVETNPSRSNGASTKGKARFNKLNELAQSINTWEDDLSHASHRDIDNATTATASKRHEPKVVSTIARTDKSPRKPAERVGSTQNNVVTNATSTNTKDAKHLKWDKSVMDALESQGFKRRDTTTKRIEYDFSDSNQRKPVPRASTSPSTKLSKPQSIVTERERSSTTTKSSATSAPSQSTKNVVNVTKGLVSGRAAIFETSERTFGAGGSSSGGGASRQQQKDPAEMSLKERMALFEKNKGNALIPKAALGIATSVKQIMPTEKRIHEPVKTVITTPQQPMISGGSSNCANAIAASSSKINNFNKPSVADSNATGSGIRQTVAALLSNPTTISESQIAEDVRKTREQEMNVLLNRFNQNSAAKTESERPIPTAPPMPIPTAPPMPKNGPSTSKSNHKRRSDEKLECNQAVNDSIEDTKRVKVNPPKSGRAYPVLSDIESVTESDKCKTPDPYTEDEEEDYNERERKLMSQYLYSSQDENEDYDEQSYMESEDSAPNCSSNGNHSEMDDYLDEALEDDDDCDDEDDDYNYRNQNAAKRGGNNGTISSNSFCFEKKPLNTVRHQTIQEEELMDYRNSAYNSPIKSQLTVNPSEDNNSVTLTHTVSFYRRQQSSNSANSTPARRMLHNQYNNDGDTDSSTDNERYDDKRGHDDYTRAQSELVDAKIKKLLDSVAIQQQQIAQASNALNTCAATFEFSGSTESVVAEWKLLVATHSRQAAVNEVTRLRVERCLRPPDAPKECGRLTVREITLPLKQEYITKLSTDKISGHHLVCLLKYNEQVLATKTIPTLPGLLAVKFPDVLQMDNVYADFKLTLEIYGMTAQREVLPHDIKYHIKNKKGGIKTPKGKKAESRLIMPPLQSPAGPNAVRTPTFVHYGFVIFSLREAQRTNWTLNQVSGVSPLVGNVHMKVNCALSVTVDYKGFLTMFEDISGFGAWHRRWCRLHGNVLSYWKYPDDERKPPIGSLDLSSCEQQKITTAPRDVCARLNTFLLELKRPRQDADEDSLVLVTQGDHTTVRHLLSADTKEERNEWMTHFNKALALMRAWGARR